ncbi:MAG TPA: hypothetical protein VHU84_04740 [Lacipirellulaceae bacterium]|nr:hypothetical protein [Lacipirellulaceae bacterium]
MLKRIMLALTFAATFGAAGLCLTDKVEARSWRWNRPYVSSYYSGPRANYGYDVPYRTYYRGYVYYGPQSYNYSYDNDPGYYYRPAPRVAVRVGPMWR